MRSIFLIIFLVLSFHAKSFAIEQAELSAPMVVDPTSTSTVRVEKLVLDWKDKNITIYVGFNGVRREFNYSGDTAVTLMTALNKANLSSNSLHKRILNQLINDGFLAGTISGSPD